ncbi:MAG: O-methyltransferase [Rikenellaceae bacterium]
MDPMDRYIVDNMTAEESLLSELVRETHLKVVQPRMLSGHIQGRLLTLLTRMVRPKRVLEIGTFTGYSGLCIAAGLEDDAKLYTVEVDDELEAFAAGFFARSEHGAKIEQCVGSALDVAPALGETFDLVFMDGDKREYPAYMAMLMGDLDSAAKPLVKSGSIIIADNILWSGKVIEPLQKNDKHTAALLDFNKSVAEDSRLENAILPLRDGLNIIRVK